MKLKTQQLKFETFTEFIKKRQLQEVGTGTNAIAVFARPIGGGSDGLIRRTPLDMMISKKRRKKSIDLP